MQGRGTATHSRRGEGEGGAEGGKTCSDEPPCPSIQNRLGLNRWNLLRGVWLRSRTQTKCCEQHEGSHGGYSKTPEVQRQLVAVSEERAERPILYPHYSSLQPPRSNSPRFQHARSLGYGENNDHNLWGSDIPRGLLWRRYRWRSSLKLLLEEGE
jgi:hypothetical protein